MPQDAIEWIREVMEYNCLGGKLNRGLLVVEWFVFFSLR